MGKKDVYVVPVENGWAVRRPNSSRISKKYKKKEDAVNDGKDLAKKDKSELTILKKDGKIQSKNSYGNDPFPPKDNE